MRLHFVARDLAANWPDLSALTDEDVDRHARRFRGGVNNWVVQTFLRLRHALAAAGIAPTIDESFLPGCVNIAHRACLNRLFAPYYRSFVVGIRADRSPIHLCDLEVVQNDLNVESPRTQFLNFWPQPGLVPRDPSRGTRVERVAYFGRASLVPAWFHDPAWHAALAGIGMVFQIRDDRWFDYSDVDVVLAHRTDPPTMIRQKPASKLSNAWLAGAPALLPDEPAYASLRKTELDYISIDSPQDALAALRRLRQSPDRYAAMADNGRRRSVDHSVEATRARWMRFLLDRVMPEASAWRAARQGVVATRLAHLGRVARQKLAAKRFKLRMRLEVRGSSWTDSAASPGR